MKKINRRYFKIINNFKNDIKVLREKCFQVEFEKRRIELLKLTILTDYAIEKNKNLSLKRENEILKAENYLLKKNRKKGFLQKIFKIA